MQNFNVRIYDYNGNLITLTMFQLIQWISALKLEMKTGMTLSQGRGKKTSSIIKERLSCPKNYKVEDLLDHLETSKANIDEQLGVA